MYSIIDDIDPSTPNSRLYQLAFLRGCAESWVRYCQCQLPDELPEALELVEFLESAFHEAAYPGTPDNIADARAFGQGWGLRDVAFGQYVNRAQFIRGCEGLLREFQMLLGNTYDGAEMEYQGGMDSLLG